MKRNSDVRIIIAFQQNAFGIADPSSLSLWKERHQTKVTPNEGTILLSPVNPAATYQVPILLFGHKCSFLVDTGAAVTLLSSTVREKCHGAVPTALTLSQCCLVGATGELLTSHGSTKLPLTIGKTDFISPVTVINGLASLGLTFYKHACTSLCN